MFHVDITFTLALIALVMGAYLALLAKVHSDNIPTLPCALIGYVVVIIALIVLLFSGLSLVGKSITGYQMHTQMMQLQRSRMMMPMHLQSERMMKILEAHQMPVHSTPKATKNMPMHGKTPLKVHTETIKK